MMVYRKRQVQQLDVLENQVNCENCWKHVLFLSFFQTEKSKWEPLRVLSKLEADHEQQTGGQNNLKHCGSFWSVVFNMVVCFSSDLMEELGLGDVDDLEGNQ